MEDVPRPQRLQPMQRTTKMALKHFRHAGLMAVLRQKLTKRTMTLQHCRPTELPVQDEALLLQPLNQLRALHLLPLLRQMVLPPLTPPLPPQHFPAGRKAG